MRRRILALVLSVIMIVASAFPVSAGTGYSPYWKQNIAGKWYVQKRDGSILKNCWFCDDSDPLNVKWYVIGADGYMIDAPLVQDKSGSFYSLETVHNGSYGMMRDKSGVYDGITIMINEIHDGTFGRITNTAAINALAKKYGVTKIEIDNSNISYASKLANAGGSGSSSRVASVVNVDIVVPAENGTYKYSAATLEVADTTVNYTNLTSTRQNVNLTSSGKDIIINAPRDTIKHYGTADSIEVIAVDNASYYGYATADSLKANAGHIVVNATIANAVTVDAKKNVDIDVSEGVKVPSIVVASDNGKSVDLTIDGNVDTVTSSTGALTFTVGPSATKVPKLEFTGEEAVKAYEDRIHAMLDEKEYFTVYMTTNGETSSHNCYTSWSDEYGTEVDPWIISDQVFDNDVYVDGDFGKIRFMNCTFNKDIIIRGTESTIVQIWPNCNFSETSKCRIENNGRIITVNDLVPKFMFMFRDPVNVICESSNGSSLGVFTDSPVIYNGTPHSISDAEYFIDQRPYSVEKSAQPYAGQPVGINYYGEYVKDSSGTREPMRFAPYDRSALNPEEGRVLRAYIILNKGEASTRIDYDPTADTTLELAFTFASSSDASPISAECNDAVTITAPYNKVTLIGYTFNDTVTIEGLYSKVIFKNCYFGKGVEIDSETTEVEYVDCSFADEGLLGEGIESDEELLQIEEVQSQVEEELSQFEEEPVLLPETENEGEERSEETTEEITEEPTEKSTKEE